MITQELLAGNGTTLIHNQLTSNLIGNVTASLTGMKNRISSVYMKEGYTYNPQIKTILFEDGCEYMEKNDWRNFCYSIVQSGGRKPGLVYLIGDLEATVSIKNLNLNFQTLYIKVVFSEDLKRSA